MKQKKISCLPALAAGILCMGLMFGADASAQVKNACSDDIAKFCKDIKPGQGALMECLEKHETELTDACRDYEQRMGGMRLERREAVRSQIRLRQACKPEMIQYCNDPKPGVGPAECLTENESKLSDQCLKALQATKEENSKKE